MKKLAIIILLTITSCSQSTERFELPYKDDYIYYETADANVFVDIVTRKYKTNTLIHDPSSCVKDKSRLPSKKHILEDMNNIKADSVVVITASNSNGQLEYLNGSYKFGYAKGYYCKSAAFFKKK